MKYIVVEVTYDYHRFQENLFVSDSKEDCLEWIKKDKSDITSEHSSYRCLYPTLEYKQDSKERVLLLCKETPHYWIQSFGPDPKLVENVNKMLELSDKLFDKNNMTPVLAKSVESDILLLTDDKEKKFGKSWLIDTKTGKKVLKKDIKKFYKI